MSIEEIRDIEDAPSANPNVPLESQDTMEVDAQLQLTLEQQASEEPQVPVDPVTESEPKFNLSEDIFETELKDVKPTVPEPAICGVCNEKLGKYKCSRCYLPYCSIACNAIHKITHPAISPTLPTVKQKTPPKTNGVGRAGTVAGSKGPFVALENSMDSIRRLFKQYPRLPAQLAEIHSATLRPLDDEEDRAQRLLLKQARDEGDVRVKHSGQERDRKWDPDRGERSGVQALKNARCVYGKDGEGVRLYGELILEILQGDENANAVELMEQQRREEDAKIIRELLQAET